MLPGAYESGIVLPRGAPDRPIQRTCPRRFTFPVSVLEQAASHRPMRPIQPFGSGQLSWSMPLSDAPRSASPCSHAGSHSSWRPPSRPQLANRPRWPVRRDHRRATSSSCSTPWRAMRKRRRGPKRPLGPRRRSVAFSTQPLGSSVTSPRGATRAYFRSAFGRCQTSTSLRVSYDAKTSRPSDTVRIGRRSASVGAVVGSFG